MYNFFYSVWKFDFYDILSWDMDGFQLYSNPDLLIVFDSDLKPAQRQVQNRLEVILCPWSQPCFKLMVLNLQKNRKQIACYWENQPGGCRKKHCPFMHKNPDARTDGIAPSQPAPVVSVCTFYYLCTAIIKCSNRSPLVTVAGFTVLYGSQVHILLYYIIIG